MPDLPLPLWPKLLYAWSLSNRNLTLFQNSNLNNFIEVVNKLDGQFNQPNCFKLEKFVLLISDLILASPNMLTYLEN